MKAMTMNKISLCLVMILLVSGCSTYSVRYTSDYKVFPNTKSEDIQSENPSLEELKKLVPRTGTYVYEQTYEVGSAKYLCYLTFLALGGTCWIYTSYPNLLHRSNIRSDAKESFDKHLTGETYELTNEKFSRLGFDYKESMTETSIDPPL